MKKIGTAMLQFSASRTSGEYFSSRQDYVDARKAPGLDQAWLCHCVASAKLPFEGPGWLTLVLGSGCLEALDADDRAAMTGLPDGVVQHLGRHVAIDASFDGDAAGSVRAFVRHLVRDRVDPTYSAGVASVQPAAVSERAADLVVFTALVTRLYHRMKSFNATALTRSGDEIAVLDPASVWWLALEDEIVKPAVRLGSQLETPLHAGDRVETLVANIVRAVKTTIDPPADLPPRVALWHVSLLTECCWYFLTQGTTVYPGWSDLLLALAVELRTLSAEDLGLLEEDGLLRLRTGMPRPAFENARLAASSIRKALTPMTLDSWDRAGRGGASSLRGQLYSSCAQLLRAQATVRSEAEQSHRPPLASAFVTTFDLELEMALLRDGGGPFVVAVPFHLVIGSTRRDRRRATSYPVWLGYVVRPGVDEVGELLRPSEWVALRDDLLVVKSMPTERGGDSPRLSHGDLHLRYGNVPVVVRLSGSPLVEPPLLFRPGTNEWTPLAHEVTRLHGTTPPEVDGTISESDPGLVLEPVVVIDEYAAMQQTATELFTPGEQNRVGLPTQITEAARDHVRFWALLGVQVGDAGMRHRVAFQISSPALTGQERLAAPERTGVVVNRRLSSEDQELLHWFGFDVVQGRCQEFIEDLRRLAEHHRSDSWHGPDVECGP